MLSTIEHFLKDLWSSYQYRLSIMGRRANLPWAKTPNIICGRQLRCWDRIAHANNRHNRFYY